MAWIESTLRDAALRDTARLLEAFLNHELPQLLGAAPLRPNECFHSYQSRKVCTAVGPIRLRRAYYRSDQGGRYAGQSQRDVADLLSVGSGSAVCKQLNRLPAKVSKDRQLRRQVKQAGERLEELRCAQRVERG